VYLIDVGFCRAFRRLRDIGIEADKDQDYGMDSSNWYTVGQKIMATLSVTCKFNVNVTFL